MENVLSSDILEKQFGPTEVSVLYQDGRTRLICTRAAGNGQVLEVSRVVFKPAGASQFAETHAAVLAGQSMGKAFKTDGIKFRRQTQAAYRLSLPAGFGDWFGDSQPAVIVAVSILAGPDQTPYADILEIYSPAIDWPESLGAPSDEHLAIIKTIDALLAGKN